MTGNAGVEPPGFSAPTLGNAIIRLMTSIDIGVKHWSNELLFIIVDENGTFTGSLRTSIGTFSIYSVGYPKAFPRIRVLPTSIYTCASP